MGEKIFFVGIDLAWSVKNNSGVCILVHEKNKCKLIHAGVALSDEEIIEIIKKNVGSNPALIAIDAPLIVPNESGRRKAEDLTSQLFIKYHASPYPTNRKNMTKWSEDIRGETLSKRLEKEKFKQDPYIKLHEYTRKFFEVYPHPAIVSMFNLDKIIEYKWKPKRSRQYVLKEFDRYRMHIKKFCKKNNIELPKKIIDKDLSSLSKKDMKAYEDMMDGIFCSLISYYAWSYPDECAVLGNMTTGYILTPVKSHMKNILSEKQSSLDKY